VPAPIISTQYGFSGSTAGYHTLAGMLPGARYKVTFGGGLVQVAQNAYGNSGASAARVVRFRVADLIPTATATPHPPPPRTPTPRPTATKPPTARPTPPRPPTPPPTASRTATPRATATRTPTPRPTPSRTPTPRPTATRTAVK